MIALTKDLTGLALDLMVASSLGHAIIKKDGGFILRNKAGLFSTPPNYSTDAAFLTTLMESLQLTIGPAHKGGWQASVSCRARSVIGYGPTPLIAACRYAVLRALGEHVEIPE